MVAVISGSGLGIFGSSVSALGGIGGSGNTAPGRGNDRVYVNTATGNLIVQSQDERLTALGLDLNLVRTYNSQGLLDDDNGDNWRLNVHQRVYNLTGIVNTVGSRIIKVFGDGREVTYEYNSTRNAYVSSEGSDAHDTLSFSDNAWTWREGTTRVAETYDSNGRLTSARDADDNTVTYGYTGSLLTSIVDASNQETQLVYQGNNLTAIRVISGGVTQTLTTYAYDSDDRLIEVTVDLSPENANDALTYVTTYTYDGASHRIASISQDDGATVEFAYQLIDGQYRVSTYTDGAGRVTTFGYTQPTGSSGSGGVPSSAPANGSALSTTRVTSHNLNTSALTQATGGWQAAALLETVNVHAATPQVLFDKFGNGFAVWAQGSDAVACRYTASTATWSAPVTLDSNTNSASVPTLAIDRETGNAVVAWVQSDGTANSLYARSYNAATDTWGTAQLLESANGAVQDGPDALSASMAGGTAVVAWVQNDGTANSIYMARLTNGSWTSPTLIESSNETAAWPRVAVDANGNALLLWRQFSGGEYRIHSRYWNGSTQSLSAIELLDGDGDRHPRVAFDGAGNAFAVWGNGTQVRRFDAATGQWSAQVSLQNGTGDGAGADLSVDAAGNALIAWLENDGTALSVYARRYDAASGSWSAATLLETLTQGANNDHFLSVSLAGNEGVVAWVHNDATVKEAYSARLVNGVWGEATLLETRSDAVLDISTAVDARGNATVVWVQADSFARSIYQAQYVAPYYVVPNGATWQSVANTLYGVNSPEAGAALQAVAGGGSLIPGARLSGLPATLAVTSTVPAYYTVRAGDTWAHITFAIYGTTDVSAIGALQTAVGNPSLVTGLELVIPANVSYTTSGSYTAPLNFNATSTSLSQSYNLNSGALTPPPATWSAAALLETDNAGASSPQLSFDTAGNGIAVWAQGSDIVMRRFVASSGTWSAPVVLDASTYEAHAPTLSVDRQTGNAVVAWVQSDGVEESLYVRRYSASTNTWGTVQLLENSAGAVEMWPQGASISMTGEHAAVVWMQHDGTAQSVYLSRLESGVWTPPALLETSNTTAMHPQVSIEANGNTTVLWRQYSATDFEYRLHSVRWNASTQAYTSLELLDADGDRFPRLAFDAAGNGFAMWGGGAQVRRFDVATGTWGPQISLDNGVGAISQEIAIDAAGNALLAWIEDDGATNSVYARRYDVTTGTWGAATLIENRSLPATIEQRLAVSISGTEAVVAWVEDTGSAWDAYAVKLSGGTWSAPALIENRSESSRELSAAIDAAGNVTIVWQQVDGYAPSIYQTRLSSTPYYTVPSGATWQSIANALYGVDSAAAGSALEAVLGSPTLTTGLQLQFLPASLVVTTTVPPRYVVQSGDTWDSIATLLYGTSDEAAVAALQSASGNPTLATGLSLTAPSTLSYSSGSTGGGAGSYLQTEVTSNGVVTRYEQDASGRLVAVTVAPDSLALRTEYEYDTDGNVTAIIRDPEGLNRITRMTYDTNGNLLSQQDDLGNTLERTYDANNQLLTETVYADRDPDGAGSGTATQPQTTRYAYDGGQHLRFSVSPTGRVTEHRYNDNGERTTTFTYAGVLYTGSAFDTASLATWTAAQDKTQLQRVDYAYLRGNLSTVTAFRTTDNTGAGTGTPSVTLFVYDQRGQLLQTVEARGSTADGGNMNVPYATTYSYDGLGRVLSVSQWNETGNVSTTWTVYDDANRATRVTMANGLVTTSLYSLAGEIISVVNGTAEAPSSLGTTTYTYDSNGRLRIQTDPTGVRQFFEYDAAGRRVAEIDGDGTLSEFIYDHLNRVIKTVVYSTRVNSATLASLVDANGQRTGVGLATIRAAADDTPDNDRISRNVYDAAGLLIYQIDGTGAVTQYFYDGAGRLTDEVRFANEVTIDRSVDQVLEGSITLTPSDQDRRTRHFYDADGLRRGTLDAAGYLVEFIYDAAGRLIHQIGYANRTQSTYWSTGTLDELRNSAGLDEETTVDPEEDVHSYFFYDGQGRRIGVLDAEGYLTETVYDVAGHASQQTRFNRHLTYTPGTSTFATLRAAAVASPTPSSHTTSFQYDGAGRVIRETNHEGTVTQYTYDSLGRLTATTRAYDTTEARTTEARYDYLGRLLQELTAEGHAQITVGMTDEDIDAIWEQYGVTYAYDSAGRRISATVQPNDSQTNVTLYYYDADGRLRFEISPLGEVKELRYDAFGQLTESIGYAEALTLTSTTGLTGGLVNSDLLTLIDGIANSTRDSRVTTAYTVRGQVSSVLKAEGSQTYSYYNAFGELETQEQALRAGQSFDVTYSYDRRGLLTESRRDPNDINAVEQRAYDAFGRLVSVTDANGGVRESRYDRLGRTIVTIGADGAERVMSYDAFDRVLRIENALEQATTFTYNDATRTTIVRTPEGVETTTIHNRHGQTLSVTAAGNTTEYSYDLNGALTGVSDNLGPLESRTYDRAGRQLTSTDARSVTTTFTYDAGNRVFTRVVDPGVGGLQITTTYHYDALGRVDLMTDATGTQTRTTYDRDGRVTEVAIDPNGLNIRTTYQYDYVGHVITTTEGAGSDNPRVTTYTYDDLGRRISEIVAPAELNLITRYEYDDNGNVTRKIVDNPDPWDSDFHTVFVYDAENRLRYTVDAQAGVTGNEYDDEGRLVQTTRYAYQAWDLEGVNTEGVVVTTAMVEALQLPSELDRSEQYVYDGDGREVFRIDAMGGVTQKEYDAAGNVIHQRMYSRRIDLDRYRDVQSVQDLLRENIDDRQSWSTFDVRNQMRFSIDALGSVIAYEYDNGGNVTRRAAYATPISTAGTLDTPALQAWAATHSSTNDQVTRTWYDAAGRARYVVDAKGYLVEYQYDDLGRVTEEIKYAALPTIVGNVVTPVISADQDQHTASVYDAAGRLKSVTTNALDAQHATETYDYDAVGNRIEYINRNGARWTYVYDGNRRLIEEHSPEVDIDRVYRASDGNGYGGTLGPSLLASETVHDSIITRMTYDVFGNVTSRTEAYGRTDQRITEYSYDRLGRQIGVRHPYAEFYTPRNNQYDRLNSNPYTWHWNSDYGYGLEEEWAPESRTYYDTFGNAIGNRDVTGREGAGEGYTSKFYDQLGRVRYILDAELYVTEYRYDTFGNQTEMIRYANRIDSHTSDLDSLESQLRADDAVDRKLVYTYDRMNRLASVKQPAGLVFEPSVGSAGGQLNTVSAVTTNTYDAFGRLIKQSQLASLSGATADTYYYYDQRDAKVGEIDALGYVTTHEYDAVGNLTATTEYAHALSSGQWNDAAFSLPDESAGEDRKLEWTYDRLNRKTSETRLGVVHHTVLNGEVSQAPSANQVTTFGYDAVGNLTRRTEASGVSTYTYYDALGRQIATAGSSRDVGGSSALIPLTTMKRDAFGNLIEQTIWANGTASATSESFADPSASGVDRMTRFLVNSHNKVLQTQDALGYNHFAMYNERGQVTREWTPIADPDSFWVASQRVTRYDYDQLGRLTKTTENNYDSGESSADVERNAVYNAFGEIVGRGLDGVVSERFEYDQAGRLWRSNADDGVYKVYLYNLLGQATAEIRSQTASLQFNSADTAAEFTAGVLRTETRYDLLGRVVEQRRPQFITSSPSQTGIEAMALTFGMRQRLGPSNPDAVYYLVPAIEGYGSETISNEYLICDPANGGWYYTADGSYFQDPNYHLESNRYIFWTPPREYDPNVRVRAVNMTFEYRPAGNPNGNWTSLRVTDLPDGSVGVDSDGLADGQYEYRVKYTRVNQVAAYATSIGTVNISGNSATFTDTTVASLAADNVTPVAVSTQIPINTQFRDANFQIGSFSGIPAINGFVYRRIVEGAVVTYVPDRGAEVSEGGGYYLTASGYVQKADYTPTTSLFVRWNPPADATLIPQFQYRRLGSAGDWQTLTTDTVGTQFSAAIGYLADGRYEYRVTYTAPEQTTPVATAEGLFEIAPTEVGSDLVLNISPPDNAGTVAPIGNRPPGSSNIVSSVTSSAHVDAYSGDQMLMVGDNTVNVQFPSISGPVRIEIEYLTLAIDAEDHPGPSGDGWAATARRISLQVANASAAGSGLNLTWRDPIAGQAAGGISQIVNVRVYALDADGNATLKYASDAASAASIGGTQMSWAAPSDTTIVATFNVRRPGAATWTPMTVTRVGGDYTVDVASLGSGPWEYEVTYTTATGVLRSRATGTFLVNAGSSVNIHENPGSGPYPIEPVADVAAVSTAPVDFNIVNSAHQTITTPSYVIVNGQMQQHQPLGTRWDEDNQLNVTWQDLGITATDTVRVEIDYTSARRYAFNYTSSEPPHWEENAAWVSGQLTRKTIEVTDAATGKLLTWEDDDASLIGGIQEVHRIRVYARVNGEWVLRYDRDAAAPKGGTSMYWSAPDDPEVDVQFQVRQVGQTTWQSPDLTLQGSRYSVDLSALATGNYEYQIKYSVTNGSVTTTTAVTRGSFAIDTTQFSGSRTQVIDVEQSNIKLTGASDDIANVYWDGANLGWSFAPTGGDTVVVRTRVVGSTTWQEQTISGSGPDFTHAFAAPAGQAYEFEISYRHSGESTAYATTSGVLNSHVAAQLKPMTVAVTQQSVTTTSIAHIADVWSLDGALSWSANYAWGSSVTFRYRLANGEWQSIPPTDLQGGYGVDLRTLPTGTYQYEIAHRVSSTSPLPTAAASGTFVIGASGINGGVAIEDRTAYVRTVTQLSTANVPTQTQSVDRWGNVTGLTDVFGRTTYYRYNQLGLLIETQQPDVDVLNTAIGVSPGTQPPISRNFYDLSGRLIATQDANGNINTVVYNAAGQILEEHHADGGVKRFEYDGFGQQVQITDEGGYRTRNIYDRVGNLTYVEKESELGAFETTPSAVLTNSYRYDQARRRTRETNAENETIRYEYDLRGNLIGRTSARGFVTKYEYDKNGNKIDERDANYDYANWWHNDSPRLTWQYDDFGRVVAHTDLGGAQYRYQYNAGGQLIQQTNSLGQNLLYFYDAAGQLERIVDQGVAVRGADVVSSSKITEYGYDLAGRRVLERTTVDGLVHQNSWTTYDVLGRIATVTDPDFKVTYSYDLVGNRTRIQGEYYDHTGVQYGNLHTQDLWYKYDSMNRVVVSQGLNINGTVSINASQGTELTYNEKGERISARTQGEYLESTIIRSIEFGDSIVYNRLTGLFTERYTYDGLGRLVLTSRDSPTYIVDEFSGTTEQMISAMSVSQKTYDRASRVITEVSWSLPNNSNYMEMYETTTSYDDDGRPMEQITKRNNIRQTRVIYGDANWISGREGLLWSPTVRNYTQETRGFAGGGAVGGSSSGGSTSSRGSRPVAGGVAAVTRTGPSRFDASWNVWVPGHFEGTGFDKAGNLHGYTVEIYRPRDGKYLYKTEHKMTYRRGETYQQIKETAASSTTVHNISLPGYGWTTRTYNVNGELVAFVDETENSKNRFFANNAQGQVLTAVQGDFDGQNNRLTISKAFNNAVTRSGINVKAQHFFSMNGQTIGSFGQLKDRDNAFTANFDINYTPVSANYPSDTPDQYVVQTGDTLRTIAARIFGDASLWYVIAEENALTDPDAALTPGTALRITNNVVTLSNAAGSFKPFNVSEALGDTTPSLPPPEPKKSRWGILGQILIVIVAIVVAYFTGIWVQGLFGEAFAAAGAVVGSVVGAAAGSAVSQGVAIALDMQDSFSWKAVGAAALSALIAPALPGGTEGWGAVIRGAASSAVNQGVNIALGLQEEFNWKAVAASAVAAPVAQWAGNKVGTAVGAAAGKEVGKLAGGFTQGIINQVSYAAFTGGKLNWTQMAADAFGNALGNAIVDEIDAHVKRAAIEKLSAHQRAEYEQAIAQGVTHEKALKLARGETVTWGLGDPTAPRGAGGTWETIKAPPSRSVADVWAAEFDSLALIDAGYGESHNDMISTAQEYVGLWRQIDAGSDEALLSVVAGIAAGDEDSLVGRIIGAPGFSETGELIGGTPSLLELADASYEDQIAAFRRGLLHTIGHYKSVLQRTAEIASGSISPYKDPSAAALLGLSGGDLDTLGIATFAGDLATGLASATVAGGVVGSALQLEQIQREVPVVGLLGTLGVLSQGQVRARLDQSMRDQLTSSVGAVSGGLGKGGPLLDFFASFGSITDAEAGRRVPKKSPNGSLSLGHLSRVDLRQMLRGVTPADIAKIPLVKQLDLPPDLQRGVLRINMGAAPFDKAVAHHLIPIEALKDYRNLLIKAAEGGFDINAASSGKWVKPTDHVGGHPKYNEYVLSLVSEIDGRSSASSIAAELQRISDHMRELIDQKKYGPWH